MRLRQLIENLNRTGEGKSAVVGWGRGMGHKGHMYLASSVITQANELGADPYFVVSRTVGKDDPIKPEEKMQIYKKVFPKHGHIFHTATDEMPDLTRVLAQLDRHGYTDITVVVGADQVKGLSYVKQYNGVPDKAGKIPFSFNSLNVIARQETNDPSREEEGPRATPMRDILMDPNKSEDEKFAVWRDAMNSELSDDEVLDLMHKAHARMQDFSKPKVRAKKEKAVAEGVAETVPMQYAQKVLNHYGADYFKTTHDTLYFSKYRKQFSIDRIRDDDSASAGGVSLSELNAVVRKLRSMRVPLSPFGEGVANVLAKAIMPAEKTLATKPLANPLKPGEMPPDIKMLINKVQNKVPLRPDEYSKLQAYKAFRDADSMSLKEANMLARALREGSAGKLGKGGTKGIDKEKKAAMKNATTLPGLNMSTGSMYMNYRMGIALAGAPTFPTKIEADNWIGGDPLISSYTEEEFEMVKAAAKQVGAGKIQNWSGKRSEEVADVNKTSTVAKVKRNKYGI